MGKKERADDVPARLSKNEFVMTADAVRAAGGGSVNKGAQRMYDIMNRLETCLLYTSDAADEEDSVDLGGKEMDLRGGGFVPIGKKEKADDVPARLSKNEFVMTADAVRAAGGGSVNEGAKRMYETMNKLEARA